MMRVEGEIRFVTRYGFAEFSFAQAGFPFGPDMAIQVLTTQPATRAQWAH